MVGFFTRETSGVIPGPNYPAQPNTLVAPFVYDWNGDGYLDIFMFNGTSPPNAIVENHPWVFLSDGSGGWVTGNDQVFSGPTATNVHPRYALFEDFNGDGVVDIYVADHGYDGPPHPGHPNVLYLSNDQGKLVNASDNLPGYSHFTHTAAAGDIDGDGDLDIYASDNNHNTPVAYFLINDGAGNFTLNTDQLPDAFQDEVTFTRFTWAGLVDLDDDGAVDLLLGEEGLWFEDLNTPSYDGYNIVAYNDGSGTFLTSDIELLPRTGSPSPVLSVHAMEVFDFTGDGRKDIFVVYFRPPTAADPVGTVTQILVNDGDGTFSDETSSRIVGSNIFLGSSTEGLVRLDINGDGYADIVARQNGPRFWLNDGDGYFTPGDATILGESDYGGIQFGSFFVGAVPGSAGPLNFFNGPIDNTTNYQYHFLRQTTPIFTGPEYADPTASGVPHFNEAYYLRVNPSAQAAVDAATYANGLEHYLAVGQGLGLRYAANVGLDDNDILTAGEFGSTLIGNGGDDTLRGEDGDDQLFGGFGKDRAEGGAGDDFIRTGPDNDTLLGGDGNDTLGASNRTDLLRGGAGNDLMLGSNGNDRLFGEEGDDTLLGGNGRDTLKGDAGADRLVGGNQDDTASYADAAAGVAVNLANGTGTAGEATGDLLIDIEDLLGSAFGDTLIGDGGDNRIDGGAGGDFISAGAGSDQVIGGSGDDTLLGGAGNDAFFFFGSDTGDDRIADFTAGAGAGDVIRLIGFGAAFDTFAEVVAAASQVGADTVIDFGGGTSITLIGVAKASLAADDFVL